MTTGRRAARGAGIVPGHTTPAPRVAANDASPLQAWVAAGCPQPPSLDVLQHARSFLASALIVRKSECLGVFERLDAACIEMERQRTSLDRLRAIAGRA